MRTIDADVSNGALGLSNYWNLTEPWSLLERKKHNRFQPLSSKFSLSRVMEIVVYQRTL